MSLTVLDVISRAMRLNGALAAGDTPDADDLADGLIAFNAMKRAWFGALIGPRLGAQSVSGASGQAENGGEYAIPAGGFTLTAPANPKAGARFGVADAGLDFAAHPCVIDPNGRLIQGSAASLTLSTRGVGGRWWYRDDAANWVLEADCPDQNAAIEFPDGVIAYMPYMLAVAMGAESGTDPRADVIAGAAEGRQVLARMYGRRGRANPEGPIGLAPLATQAG